MDRFRDIYLTSRDQPDILARRRERRGLRRAAQIIVILLAVIVGTIGGLDGGVGGMFLSVGRSLAGAGMVGLAGLMIGVLITAIAVLVYNGILNGRTSLIDLDYIDEIPLFVGAVAAVVGIVWSLQWAEVIGLFGWGFLALVVNELIFRRPDDKRS